MSSDTNPNRNEGMTLNLFCTPEDGAWRVYVRPTWMPRYLHRCFDEHGEAFPAVLDFEDLDRQMSNHGAQFEKRISKRGDVELIARGHAANELALWFSNAFITGMRVRGDAAALRAAK
jgi:hypothetical protein